MPALPAHAFREYDIRGIAGDDITAELAHRLGMAYATMLPDAEGRPVVVGRDVRLTAPALQHAVIAGLHAAGIDDADAEHGPVFETRNFAIQAAIDGLGVAVVDPHLVAEELKSGRLIQPFAELPISRGAYYLVYPDRIASAERFKAFRAWLLSEAQGA